MVQQFILYIDEKKECCLFYRQHFCLFFFFFGSRTLRAKGIPRTVSVSFSFSGFDYPGCAIQVRGIGHTLFAQTRMCCRKRASSSFIVWRSLFQGDGPAEEQNSTQVSPFLYGWSSYLLTEFAMMTTSMKQAPPTTMMVFAACMLLGVCILPEHSM